VIAAVRRRVQMIDRSAARRECRSILVQRSTTVVLGTVTS